MQNAFPQKFIAFTFDDLPVVCVNKQEERKRVFYSLLNILRKYSIKTVGFVISGKIKNGESKYLQDFIEAGNELGNHTHLHNDIFKTKLEIYIDDIEKCDTVLKEIVKGRIRYFRFPYLHRGFASTRRKIGKYLENRGYRLIPVSFISYDHIFNKRYLKNHKKREKIKAAYIKQTLKRIIKAEEKWKRLTETPVKLIGLFHFNTINADCFEEIIRKIKEAEFTLTSPEEILKDNQAVDLIRLNTK